MGPLVVHSMEGPADEKFVQENSVNSSRASTVDTTKMSNFDSAMSNFVSATSTFDSATTLDTTLDLEYEVPINSSESTNI